MVFSPAGWHCLRSRGVSYRYHGGIAGDGVFGMDGGGGKMRGIGAKTGLGARGGWWYVWFIVLWARMDCRGVFGGVAFWWECGS